MLTNAKWIYNEKDIGTVSPVFVKKITVAEGLTGGVASVSAMGVYELVINGRRVGDARMTPGFTSYKNRVQYQTYEITDYLHEGENEIAIHTGGGWALGMAAQWHETNTFYDHICAIASLSFTYGDGEVCEVVTDDSWSVYTSEVLSSEVYHGETQDLTRAWEYVGEASVDTALVGRALVPQEGEWIRERERVGAKSLIVTPKGERVIDFGQNLAGYVEIRIKGNKGDRIVLSHAEVLDRDGNFYTDNYRSAKNIMTYVLSGGEDVLKPKFTFQGYRYIRLDEYPFDEVELDAFTSVAVYSDMKRTGHFSSGNAKINQLYSNILWGQRSNFLDIPTDCPQRDERLGWTADAQVFCRTAAINYDTTRFFKKWLSDMRLEQAERGGIPHVVPDVLGYEEGKSSSVWADAATVVPWEVYLASGDASVLRENIGMMCRWIDYMHTYGDEEYGFMGAWHYGDWLAMDAGEGQYRGATQTDLIACAFFAYSTDIVVRALKVLGEDAGEYEALYEKVRAHFRCRFMKDGLPVLYPKYDGLSTDRPVSAMTQTAIVLILKFGLYEEGERALLAKTLVDMIRANGTRMTTGFVGTPYILHVLSDNGYADVAYDLLLQEASPSWLFSVNHGATTMWEHWDSQKEDGTFWSTDMNSFNHYAYGSVFDWIFGVGTGITVCPDGAGYEKVKIAPTPDARLGYMDASIETKGGLLRSAWRYHDDHIRFEITVPDGTSALVTLPDGFERTLTGGEYVFVRTIGDETAQ